MKKQIFIAEPKIKSPFGFKSFYQKDALNKLAIEHGDWLSVHVDELWGGSRKELKYCADNYDMPILAKGLHLTDNDIQNSLQLGADYALVVRRIPPDKFISKCLMEPLSMYQLNSQYIEAINRSAGVVFNKRDLRTGKDRESFGADQDYWHNYWASSFEHLRKLVKVPIFQASGIKSVSDVLPEVDGYIVGECLPQFVLSKQIKSLEDA